MGVCLFIIHDNRRMDDGEITQFETSIKEVIEKLRVLVSQGAPQNQLGMPDYCRSFGVLYDDIKVLADIHAKWCEDSARGFEPWKGGSRKTRKSRCRR